MSLSQTELLNEAKKLELQGFKRYQITPVCISKLNKLLNEVYAIHRPKPIDYHNRRDLIRIFNEIAKELYGISDNSPVVEGFGSFVMDMFSAGSDLDLSVNFSNIVGNFPREMKIKTLRKFAKKFYALQRAGHVLGVQTIMNARVPIVKFIDCGSGIECDLSVENRDGIQKSQIIHIISGIDERFQKLSFLMKAWAKAHNINSPKDRTLSSLSIIQLVAFHLQTRDPPIIPPFSDLFEDGTDPVIVGKRVKTYSEFGKSNKESLADLFITMLAKVASVENLWVKGLCASLFEGSWTSKLWDTQYNVISVEDFTDSSQNVARAVGREQFKEIYGCIHSSLSHLLAFSDDQRQGHKLVDLLFGAGSRTIPRPIHTKSNDQSRANVSLPLNGHQVKRMRVSEHWTEKQREEEGWIGKQQAPGWGTAQKMEGTEERQMNNFGGRQQRYGEATPNLYSPLASCQAPMVASLGSTLGVGALCSVISQHSALVSRETPKLAANSGNSNVFYGSTNLTAVPAVGGMVGSLTNSVARLPQSASVSQQSFLGFDGSHHRG